jgi:hypothetical protein
MRVRRGVAATVKDGEDLPKEKRGVEAESDGGEKEERE